MVPHCSCATGGSQGASYASVGVQLAPGHYPLSQATSFAWAKAEFDKARMVRSGVATPSNKPTIGAMGTSATAGATTMCSSNAVGVGVGPIYQQRQITRTVGQSFANLIPTPGVPFLTVQPSVSLPQSPPHPSISPALVDYSSPSISSLSTQLPKWLPFLQQYANFIPNSPLLGQVAALDLSRIPQMPE